MMPLKAILATALAVVPITAFAQSTPPSIVADSAAQALQYLLDRNIQPSAGPLTGDGATIAGVLAGQSLTFPLASSSGAFVSIPLRGFGPDIPVSASGNFGPLFAERGLTNGPGNFSLSLHYQHKVWRSVSGIKLRGFDLSGRSVFREDDDLPEGTTDDFAADIDFRTHVFVLSANYGVFRFLDIGVSLPYVHSTVRGTKVGTRTIPRGPSVVRAKQEVSGTSRGIGDPIIRVKGRVETLGLPGTRRLLADTLQVALGYDLRLPTGKTATLELDCSRPPCANADTQEVPDIGLGQMTHKWSVFVSSELGRLSPHVNLGYIRVPPYECSERRFGSNGRCRGTIFEIDPINGNQDAKNQNLSNEWNATIGVDYQLRPFRSTISADVIGRQLIRAGQFFDGPARLVFRDGRPSSTISTRIESRHGNVNSAVGVIGAKVGIYQRWVIVGNVLFPLNTAGLQPTTAWVIGLERALTR